MAEKEENSPNARKSALQKRLCWLRDTRFEGKNLAVALATGKGEGEVSRWMNGVRPQQKNAEQIARAAGPDVSAEWIRTGEGPAPEEWSDKGMDTAFAPEARPPKTPAWTVTRQYVPGYREVDRDDLPDEWIGYYVPVINSAAAGTAHVTTDEADQHPPGTAASYIEYQGAPKAVAIRVSGDLMRPDGYENGDVVVTNVGDVRPGQVAVVVYEDPDGAGLTAKLKRYHPGGQAVELRSSNPAYRPVRVPRGNVVHVLEVIDHLPKMIAVRGKP